jgi:hypothetical protein
MGKRIPVIVNGQRQVLWNETKEIENPVIIWRRMMESERQQDEPCPVREQQEPQGGRDSGQDVPPPGVDVPIRPQGPHPPNHNNKTGRRGTECRDRWRLGVEIVAVVIGVVGLYALIQTLSETRNQVNIAQRSLEVSTRAWMNISHGKLVSALVSDAPVKVGITLRNVGKTPAQDVTANLAVGPHPKCECAPLGKIESFGSIGPGAKVTVTGDINPHPLATIESVEQGRLNISFCGEILYKDEFSQRRRTTFNLSYTPNEEKKFTVCPNGNFME